MRVFGTVLVGLGGILLASVLHRSWFTVERVIFASALFAGAVTAAQTQAIWHGWLGFVLAAFLAVVGSVAGAHARGNRARELARNAA